MPILEVTNLGKIFKVYASPVECLRDVLTPRWLKRFRNRRYHTEFQALDSISLSLEPGAGLGIIGRNGSGKSTLLNIISGALQPTSGTVRINGRAAALLELGSGFHRDFSGRQNIEVNATFLGLSGKEIKSRLAEIIDFSELGDFIERPVRTYSSGMLLRLGFSIAAFLDADVLIVDELLSVGDLAFQKKCLARIHQLKDNGCAILLASHNLGDLAAVCDRLLWLEQGRILADNTTETMLQQYSESCDREAKSIGFHPLKPLLPQDHYGPRPAVLKILQVQVLDNLGQPQTRFHTGAAISLVVEFETYECVVNPLIRIHIHRNDGYWIHGNNTYRHGLDCSTRLGRYRVSYHIQALNLLAGDYYLSIGIWPDEFSSWVMEQAYDLHDLRYKLTVDSDRGDGDGVAAMQATWTFEPCGSSASKSDVRADRI